MASKQSSKQNLRQKSSKGFMTATYLQRSIETKDERPRFLIVCEGEKTEPNYFKALAAEFKLSVKVEVEGLGDNTDSLVERAIMVRGEDDYAQAWCVFDRDSFPPHQFNRAIQLAENNGFRVAYSNEAFELWFILHFEYLQAGLLRGDYKKKLTRHLGKKYQKNSRTMFSDLNPFQSTAIRHATQLLLHYSPHNPEQDNPSTTVHLLVQELLKFQRE